MGKFATIFVLTVFALATAGLARAEDGFAGKWKGQFDSQIGLQKYTFNLKVSGTNVTGTATGERDMGTNEVTITEGSAGTNTITFVESLKFGDNELRIVYTGRLYGDEIKFHRKVGDVAEEDFTAHRLPEPGVSADPKVETNSATAPPPIHHRSNRKVLPDAVCNLVCDGGAVFGQYSRKNRRCNFFDVSHNTASKNKNYETHFIGFDCFHGGCLAVAGR
jgi:hypothetical protein